MVWWDYMGFSKKNPCSLVQADFHGTMAISVYISCLYGLLGPF